MSPMRWPIFDLFIFNNTRDTKFVHQIWILNDVAYATLSIINKLIPTWILIS